MTPGLARLSSGRCGLLLWTANMLLFSAVLQVGLVLPMASTFHRVAWAGILLNALAIPLNDRTACPGRSHRGAGRHVPTLAVWPAKALAVVMTGLFSLDGPSPFAAWLSFRVPNPPSWVGWGLALSLLVAALSCGRHAWTFRASLAGVGLMTALVALHPFPPQPAGRSVGGDGA